MAVAVTEEEVEREVAARHEEGRAPETEAAETPAWSSQNREQLDVATEEAEEPYEGVTAHTERTFVEEGTELEEEEEQGSTQHAALHYAQHEAPSAAPEGLTLEHETLDDDEIEYHPVPENLDELSEVAGDAELDLVEETLDADNGYNERWIPKVADVDEDEVVAAEERGETAYPASEEEEDEEEDDEAGTNGRAELRASNPTAGYQQRAIDRPGYDRRPPARTAERRTPQQRSHPAVFASSAAAYH